MCCYHVLMTDSDCDVPHSITDFRLSFPISRMLESINIQLHNAHIRPNGFVREGPVAVRKTKLIGMNIRIETAVN